MDNGNTALMCYGPADQARYEQVSQILRGHGLNPVNEDRHRIIRYAGDHDIALAILSLEAGLPDTTMGVQLATGLLSVKPELPVYRSNPDFYLKVSLFPHISFYSSSQENSPKNRRALE